MTKRETKELGIETRPWEGVVRRSFHTVGNPPTRRSVGSFGISEGKITGRKKKNPQNKNSCLTATASREVAQMLEFTTSEWGLDREAWASCLG